MWPFTDITLYFQCDLSKLGALKSELGVESRYVADFYHNSLNGYKPPKTGRLTIMLDSNSAHPGFQSPSFFGAICSIRNTFDTAKYSSLTKPGRYQYLLDTIHQTCLICVDRLKWERSIFEEAYSTLLSHQFKYSRNYPEKHNRSRTHKARIVLEKDETSSFLFCCIAESCGKSEQRFLLRQSSNLYWYDPVYRLAKSAKWFNNDCFGFSSQIAKMYFSVSQNSVIKEAKGNFN